MSIRSGMEMSAVLRCSTALRATRHGTTMEEVASAIVGCLRGHFIDPESNESLFPLVRCYLTQPQGDGTLLADGAPRVGAHVGSNPGGVQLVLRPPMIARVIEQLGIDLGHVIEPNPAMSVVLEERPCEIFFVPEALGSS